jgi:hypothetical protein
MIEFITETRGFALANDVAVRCDRSVVSWMAGPTTHCHVSRVGGNVAT